MIHMGLSGAVLSGGWRVSTHQKVRSVGFCLLQVLVVPRGAMDEETGNASNITTEEGEVCAVHDPVPFPRFVVIFGCASSIALCGAITNIVLVPSTVPPHPTPPTTTTCHTDPNARVPNFAFVAPLAGKPP